MMQLGSGRDMRLREQGREGAKQKQAVRFDLCWIRSRLRGVRLGLRAPIGVASIAQRINGSTRGWMDDWRIGELELGDLPSQTTCSAKAT